MRYLKKRMALLVMAALPLAAAMVGLSCCTTDNGFEQWEMPGDLLGGGSGSDDGDAPGFDPTITDWDGQKADDAELDVVGTNGDIYWEKNAFGNDNGGVTVKVVYSESSATVNTSDNSVICYTDGAYVTVDMLTNSVKNVEIVVSGKSGDGQLKIYGEKKFKLTLSGVELTSSKGPAINDQCKKRAFVHLTEGTINRLTDAATYSEEPRYLNGGSSASEDRKGCFFSEGNLIFSGTGVLAVEGNYKHGIATDGYFYMRPGVTIAVTGAAKNAVHVKGDEDDGIGVYVAGGLLYANVSSTAGKGIKTDLDAEITGGKLLLNTSGNATYDDDEKDTSSSACIKTDGSVIISGGTHTLKSTGTGGKGINADGEVRVSGGETTVTTTGGKYYYSQSLTSSPKGVKADGDITISGGKLNISVTGVSDGSEGLESKATLTVTGGEVYSYAYDDAINAASAINISGGKVYAYASNNDGIDSNGSLVISGGLVIGVGASAPESGIDCDNSNSFRIDGGTVIGMGGTLQSNPSSSSTQRSVVYNGVSATKGAKICMLDASGTSVLTFAFPRTMSGAAFFFSTPDIASGASYTVSSGGTLGGYTDSWNGWYAGGTWSGGSQVGTFTSSSVVTTVGNGNTPGGGGIPGGGGPGGRPGGW